MSTSASVRSRHSLYGIEDRIVIDIGSRLCLIGFSGEVTPRATMVLPEDLDDRVDNDGRVTFDAGNSSASAPFLGDTAVGDYPYQLHDRDPDEDQQGSESDADGRLTRLLRTLFLDHLLLDPRQRKVLILENPMMRRTRKAAIARSLFEYLCVPSVSFVSHSLCSLLAVGRTTGLVIDIGQSETTIVPTFVSRPLFPRLTVNSRGALKLTRRLAKLVTRFARFIPIPPTTTASPSSTPSSQIQSIPVSPKLITRRLLEEIQSKLCFIEMSTPPLPVEFKGATTIISDTEDLWVEDNETDEFLDSLKRQYKSSCNTSDARIHIPASSNTGSSSGESTQGGYIILPGWIRQFAVEFFFEFGDEDESSLPEAVLDCLLKLPVDLRKPLASSILICGGTAMCPGFISRFRVELLRILTLAAMEEPSVSSYSTSLARFKPLSLLRKSLAILNDPCLPYDRDPTRPDQPYGIDAVHKDIGAGSAPPFPPATIPWIGASIAGALKTGGDEITRDKWEEAGEVEIKEEEMEPFADDINEEEIDRIRERKQALSRRNCISDWTTLVR